MQQLSEYHFTHLSVHLFQNIFKNHVLIRSPPDYIAAKCEMFKTL